MRQEHEVTSFTLLLSLHFSISPQACEIGNPCKEGEGPFLLSPQVEGVGRGVCVHVCFYLCTSMCLVWTLEAVVETRFRR